MIPFPKAHSAVAWLKSRSFFYATARRSGSSEVGLWQPSPPQTPSTVIGWRWDPEEFIDAGERVVAVLRVHATGRESGAGVERVDGALWTMRDGKCVRLDYYGSKQQALEAAGLGE